MHYLSQTKTKTTLYVKKNFKMTSLNKNHINKKVNTTLFIEHSNHFSMLININIKQKITKAGH
jgi:hypothetical protein